MSATSDFAVHSIQDKASAEYSSAQATGKPQGLSSRRENIQELINVAPGKTLLGRTGRAISKPGSNRYDERDARGAKIIPLNQRIF